MRLLVGLGIVLLLWAGVCAWYYVRQESLIFFPSRLPAEHEFTFSRPFEVHRIDVAPDVSLSALLFHSAYPSESTGRQAVLYLHGNAGDLQSWGSHADLYLDHGYDFLVIDYRGYGLSGGRVSSEAELHADIQAVWDWMAGRYEPGSIVVVGYSLGSAVGARVACANQARHLVLIAPFVSGRDMGRRVAPWLPPALIRYPFRTDQVLESCDVPVTLFHGTNDGTIPPISSTLLLGLLGDRGRLHVLPGIGHSDVAESEVFRHAIGILLTRLLNPEAQ
jgi:pimeloyl-ACP methyl ester carboxylesterase